MPYLGKIIDTLKFISDIAAYVLAIIKLLEWAVGGLKSWWRVHRLPPKEIIERRVKMREEIENSLRWERRYIDSPATETHLATRIEVIDFEEIIIRDIQRMDAFPKINERDVGISPWFKVEVSGFYDRGIEVFLSDWRKAVPALEADSFQSNWSLVKQDDNSESAVDVVAIGRIPFEFIERVDWSRSDGYYDTPHFYCRFSGPLREPYEDVFYKANLYPEISTHYHDLGLRKESYEWGFMRRWAFLFRQDLIRYWRRWLKIKKKVRRG